MNAADTRLELTDEVGGRWIVTTANQTVLVFDCTARTVERLGGRSIPATPLLSGPQSLRGIVDCRVGAPCRWWVRNSTGGYTDPDQVWLRSSVVVSIVAESETTQ
jgi:hypothetical protein